MGVLHYHMLRSGVRTVIANSLRALIAYGQYDSLTVDLIAGDACQPSGQALAGELRQWAADSHYLNFELKSIELTGLRYQDKPAEYAGFLLRPVHWDHSETEYRTSKPAGTLSSRASSEVNAWVLLLYFLSMVIVRTVSPISSPTSRTNSIQ